MFVSPAVPNALPSPSLSRALVGSPTWFQRRGRVWYGREGGEGGGGGGGGSTLLQVPRCAKRRRDERGAALAAMIGRAEAGFILFAPERSGGGQRESPAIKRYSAAREVGAPRWPVGAISALSARASLRNSGTRPPAVLKSSINACRGRKQLRHARCAGGGIGGLGPLCRAVHGALLRGAKRAVLRCEHAGGDAIGGAFRTLRAGSSGRGARRRSAAAHAAAHPREGGRGAPGACLPLVLRGGGGRRIDACRNFGELRCATGGNFSTTRTKTHTCPQ